MEGLSGNCFASHCRDFISHPALGRHSGNLANHQGTVYPDITAQDIGRQCPAHQASSGTSLSYGYPFGSPYYGCRLSYPRNVNLQQKAYSYHPAEKCMESSSALPAEELSSRSKELGVYPSFASSYQTVPGVDVPVVPGISAHPESRHESFIPMDRYQHWAMSNGWEEQRYCSKEQTHFNNLWKSQFSGKMTCISKYLMIEILCYSCLLPVLELKCSSKVTFFKCARETAQICHLLYRHSVSNFMFTLALLWSPIYAK